MEDSDEASKWRWVCFGLVFPEWLLRLLHFYFYRKYFVQLSSFLVSLVSFSCWYRNNYQTFQRGSQCCPQFSYPGLTIVNKWAEKKILLCSWSPMPVKASISLRLFPSSSHHPRSWRCLPVISRRIFQGFLSAACSLQSPGRSFFLTQGASGRPWGSFRAHPPAALLGFKCSCWKHGPKEPCWSPA